VKNTVQIMSVLTGCMAGAKATGLINPDVRADAYTDLNTVMNVILGGTCVIARALSKAALMTSCYGSQRVPKVVFGEDTPELEAFYEAVNTIAPGAWELLQDLLASWQPGALAHCWQLPDGFEAKVKVMTKQEGRIEVDELDGASFTYLWYENQGTDKGRSNVANVVHSIDGFILREMIRRCNYDSASAYWLMDELEAMLLERHMGAVPGPLSNAAAYYSALFERTRMPSAVILSHLTSEDLQGLSTEHLLCLKRIVNQLLEHKPFPIITIHDSFGAHANNVNRVRYWYKEILAELADAEVLSDIMNQLHNSPNGSYPKLSQDLSQYIRNSNYALS